MKIFLTSDIHYGFDETTHRKLTKWLKECEPLIEQADLMIGAGDWISHKQESFPKVFKLFRDAFKDKDILAVFGNHDCWSIDLHPYEEMRDYQKKIMNDFGIHYLPNNPYIKLAKYTIFGFDGFYSQIPPRSNDPKWMPKVAHGAPIHLYLNHKAHKHFEKILIEARELKEKDPDHKTICVTHFNLKQDPGWEFMSGNPTYLDFIAEVPFDLLLWGHNHKIEDFKHDYMNKCVRVVNAGSDYNKPRGVLIEI